jgi:phosphatidylserine decarboxylase
MTLRSAISRVSQRESVNFLLTNHIPRAQLTRFMGWFSRIEHPWVCNLSIAIWRLFVDLDLQEAKQTRFKSLHDCFTRELKEGARPVNHHPAVVISPCDAIIGATGQTTDGLLLQAKGRPYRLMELLNDAELVRYYEHGWYATLRLTAGMYHRFHAPCACRVEQVTYVAGDTWNVNPITLSRIDRLFCQNERATVRCRMVPSGLLITMVPIAAILVAGIRLHFLDLLLHLRYRGANVIACEAALRKGQEMGWFQHGSTIIVFAPASFSLCEGICDGARIRMGQALFEAPSN